MFISYNELKNESKLPPDSYFIDPYDRDKVYIKEGETLKQFQDRLSQIREDKGLSPIEPEEFKTYIQMSLYESSSKDKRAAYFISKAKLPQFSELVSFVKTAVTEVYQTNKESVQKRENRASKCLAPCKLHVPLGNSFLEKATKRVVGVLANSITAKEAFSYPDERKLGKCGMCGCFLQEKVKFNNLSNLAGVTPDNLNKILAVYKEDAFDACWMLHEAVRNQDQKKVLTGKLKNTKSGIELLEKYTTGLIKKLKK